MAAMMPGENKQFKISVAKLNSTAEMLLFSAGFLVKRIKRSLPAVRHGGLVCSQKI